MGALLTLAVSVAALTGDMQPLQQEPAASQPPALPAAMQERPAADQNQGVIARYYDPRVSAWVSPDSLLSDDPDVVVRQPRDLSAYSYGRLNPIILLDPDGR